MTNRNITTNKIDTSINWSKSTFIPLKGEIIVYSDLNTFKVGDGIHTLNELDFATSKATVEDDTLTL